jgi:hypothetical protein
MAEKNRWHPCLLPDEYLRKLKQNLSEVEAQVESKTRRVPVFEDDPPPDYDAPPPSDDDPPP